MHIEIAAFYEESRNDANEYLSGTLHITLPQLGVEIRGIYVLKKKATWVFYLPWRKGKDVRYPVFSFTHREKTGELNSVIREKAIPYLVDYIENTPQKATEAAEAIRKGVACQSQHNRAKAPEKREKPQLTIARAVVKVREWVDPPPRRPMSKSRTVVKSI